MAISDVDSLALGNTPNTNLQLILDSLNLLDVGSDISLTDLANIGVTGVGGTEEITLATLNAELNGEENTNDVQVLVDALQATDNSTSRLETESLTAGDLATLGIIGLDDNSVNIERINNILEDADVSIGSDTVALQALVDVLIKIDDKDGNSSATDITQEEWQLIGLNNVSSPDANELNIALANSNSLDLGTTPLSNLQTIVDSLNALDEVKYGRITGVTLTDLTNIGVTGVGGVDEPTLEAVNAVLYDNDVSADHTNSVQDVVDAINALNESDGTWSIDINESDLDTLGITAPDGIFSSNELEYMNYRIGENTPYGSGDGNYINDTVELQALIDTIDGQTISIGSIGDDTYTYVANELYDAVDGYDTLNVLGGTIIDLTAIHDIEEIVLNSDASANDSSLGFEFDEISVADVLDITDGSGFLTIRENDGDGVERVYLDTTEFETDGELDADGDYAYVALDGSGVTIYIAEQIVVD
jgi:hypothetical protein